MFGKVAGEVLDRGITAISNDISSEKSKISSVFRAIISYPVKVLATFIAAPVLVIKVAWTVKDPLRRTIAIVGLVSSLLAAYLAGTLIGGFIAAFFIMFNIGFLSGIGFLFGTTLSVYLSVVFSIIVFNTVSFFFLKMSKQEVVDYLSKEST